LGNKYFLLDSSISLRPVIALVTDPNFDHANANGQSLKMPLFLYDPTHQELAIAGFGFVTPASPTVFIFF
jgi:hypothetical protein